MNDLSQASTSEGGPLKIRGHDFLNDGGYALRLEYDMQGVGLIDVERLLGLQDRQQAELEALRPISEVLT